MPEFDMVLNFYPLNLKIMTLAGRKPKQFAEMKNIDIDPVIIKS